MHRATPAAQNDRWVVASPGGGWFVELRSGERVSDVWRSEDEAVEQGVEVVSALGGGQLYVQDVEGFIHRTLTVLPTGQLAHE